MNRLLKGIGVLIALIAVGVVSAFAVIALLMRQEEVKVPDLVGQEIVTVVDLVNQQGLRLKIDRREPSQTIPRDAVISQIPLPGTGIKKGRSVSVVVSQGPSELLTPRVVGEQYRKAEIDLRQAGLMSADLARIWSATVGRDTVIAQDPPAGTPIEKGGQVSLLVSQGRQPRVFVMPRLIGRKAVDAVRFVNRMGIQHHLISRPSSTGGAGADRIVVGQRPAAGAPLPSDGTVELTVNR